MKLIMETWRRYVEEQVGSVTKLRIFDFDETIATTRSSTRVTTPDGRKLEFDDQEKYDQFVKKMALKNNIKTINPDGTARDSVSDLMKMGYMFDYSDFSNVIDPQENDEIVKILGRVVGAKQEREKFSTFSSSCQNQLGQLKPNPAQRCRKTRQNLHLRLPLQTPL